MQKLQTIDIKGKDYVLVNERIRAFRENYKGYALMTEMLSNENGVCLMKATITDENGKVVATGHAYEKENSSFINKTSYIENCETSAWGRALGNLGIGVENSIASYEEVANAIVQQGKTDSGNFAEIVNGEPIKCEVCGKVIMDSGKYTADQIAEKSQIKYGKTMCAACVKKAAGDQK